MNPSPPNVRPLRRVILLAAASLLLVGASCAADPTSTEPASTASSSTTAADRAEPVADTADRDATDRTTAAGALGDEDIAGLLWMREEEQLAHDVYVALGELWGLRVFDNIAASETTHIDAVVGLLERYGIDDPAAGNEPGTFTDPDLQALYDQLLADGRRSVDAALRVGVTIEELDIADLRDRRTATDIAAISTVYADLERASRNHLRAFVSQLDARASTDLSTSPVPDTSATALAPAAVVPERDG